MAEANIFLTSKIHCYQLCQQILNFSKCLTFLDTTFQGTLESYYDFYLKVGNPDTQWLCKSCRKRARYSTKSFYFQTIIIETLERKLDFDSKVKAQTRYSTVL